MRFNFSLIVVFVLAVNGYAEGSSIWDLYPNPYKMFQSNNKNKNQIEKIYFDTLNVFVKNNCSIDKFKNQVGFCKYYEGIQKYKLIQEKLTQSISLQKIILDEDRYLVASLWALNFELDFLLSEDEAHQELDLIIKYLESGLILNPVLISIYKEIFKNEHSGVVGKSTVIPTMYSSFSSSNSLEVLIRYLELADCQKGQKLCNYFLKTLYEDYLKVSAYYQSEVLDPLLKIKNFIKSGDFGSFIPTEEVRWTEEVLLLFENKKIHAIVSDVMYSSGHLGDREHQFKSDLIKILLTENALNTKNKIIESKAKKWILNSESLNADSRINTEEIPYRFEVLKLFTDEILKQKSGVIDLINEIESEVVNVGTKEVI